MQLGRFDDIHMVVSDKPTQGKCYSQTISTPEAAQPPYHSQVAQVKTRQDPVDMHAVLVSMEFLPHRLCQYNDPMALGKQGIGHGVVVGANAAPAGLRGVLLGDIADRKRVR